MKPISNPLLSPERHLYLRRRYRYLWSFELFDCVLFVFLYWLGYPTLGYGPLTGWALAFVIFIVLQGSFYWFLKLRNLEGRPLLTKLRFQQIYRTLKKLNLLFVLAFPTCYLLATGLKQSIVSNVDLVLGSLLYVFAVLELINYYYYQLMYDNSHDLANLFKHRSLKRARLAIDLTDPDNLAW